MEEIARFDLDMDGSMDAFEDGRWVRYDDVQIKIAALEAERDALRADAARWRMLLEQGAPMGLIDWGILGLRNQDTAGLTAAIDAAIAAKEPK